MPGSPTNCAAASLSHETVGMVDDINLGDDRLSYVVVSTGGFPGGGNELAALPYEAIRKTDEKVIMRDQERA